MALIILDTLFDILRLEISIILIASGYTTLIINEIKKVKFDFNLLSDIINLILIPITIIAASTSEITPLLIINIILTFIGALILVIKFTLYICNLVFD